MIRALCHEILEDRHDHTESEDGRNGVKKHVDHAVKTEEEAFGTLDAAKTVKGIVDLGKHTGIVTVGGEKLIHVVNDREKALEEVHADATVDRRALE